MAYPDPPPLMTLEEFRAHATSMGETELRGQIAQYERMSTAPQFQNEDFAAKHQALLDEYALRHPA